MSKTTKITCPTCGSECTKKIIPPNKSQVVMCTYPICECEQRVECDDADEGIKQLPEKCPTHGHPRRGAGGWIQESYMQLVALPQPDLTKLREVREKYQATPPEVLGIMSPAYVAQMIIDLWHAIEEVLDAEN